jgi:alkaline phosphatase
MERKVQGVAAGMLLLAIMSMTCLAPPGAVADDPPQARHVILLIGDGWGASQIEATEEYTGLIPAFRSWRQHWMSTYPADGGYAPERAWSDFDYVVQHPTDSAASATALYSGTKTTDGRVAVSPEGLRLPTIADKARALGRAVGAVTTVAISHATPGTWYAHNDDRFNGGAIAEEGLFGDPAATWKDAGWRRTVDEWRNALDYLDAVRRRDGVVQALREVRRGRHRLYGGGHGPTLPAADVIIGADSPGYVGERYLSPAIREALAAAGSRPGSAKLVERIPGQADGGARLLAAASRPEVTRLAGLFGFTYRRADGSGRDPENPTLAEMTTAALRVLGRNPHGFVLMVESGAIDFAGHANSMDWLIGEQVALNEAIDAVVRWVEDPTNGSWWDDTLVIVTGDHETGLLTAAPGVFPDRPLGEVSPRTLALEKQIAGSERRASWEDRNGNRAIDPGEPVHWAWNSGDHTNQLVPLYAKGAGAALFANLALRLDPVRGPYLDNTDVFRVMNALVVPESFRRDDGMEMVVVPEGEAFLGCNEALDRECDETDRPGRRVHVNAFAIDRTEVSVGQYRRCVQAGACSGEGLDVPVKEGEAQPEWSEQCNWGRPGRERHPINCVNWLQADAYCRSVGGLLPSETEWEKAARGIDGRRYPWGDLGFQEAGAVANIGDAEAKRHDPELEVAENYTDGFYRTAPVGSFPAGASPYGVLDMIGNVWEWTADPYPAAEVEAQKPALDRLVSFVMREAVGTGHEEASSWRAVRGASWKNPPQRARVSHRPKDLATDRFGNMGFRCVLPQPEARQARPAGPVDGQG